MSAVLSEWPSDLPGSKTSRVRCLSLQYTFARMRVNGLVILRCGSRSRHACKARALFGLWKSTLIGARPQKELFAIDAQEGAFKRARALMVWNEGH